MELLSNRRIDIEQILVITLSLVSVSIFFSQSGIDIFGLVSLFLLLVWRFIVRHKPALRLPRYLVITCIVFLLNALVSATLSDNRSEGFRLIQKYWNLFLCGLLFTCPLTGRNRKRVITVFLAGAFLAGLMGILQYYGILPTTEGRAHGFTHPIHYAGNLAFSFAAALILVVIPDLHSDWRRKGYFIAATILTTFGGILFSQSRGVWIALFVSCTIVLFFYKRRIALVFVLLILTILVTVLFASGTLRHRAVSIVTSAYSEDERGSTGNRIELWRGALKIFEDSPLLGTGMGSFQNSFERLIAEGRVKDVPIKMHAHNIFLQTLATQGIVGFVILLALFVALISWGVREIKDHGNMGGYVILMSTLLVIVGGLTDDNIEISKFFAAYCLTVGLFGGYGSEKDKVNAHL